MTSYLDMSASGTPWAAQIVSWAAYMALSRLHTAQSTLDEPIVYYRTGLPAGWTQTMLDKTIPAPLGADAALGAK